MVNYNDVCIDAILPVKNSILNFSGDTISSKEQSDFSNVFFDPINLLKSAFTEEEIQQVINSSCTTEKFKSLSKKMREHMNLSEDMFFNQPGWFKEPVNYFVFHF